MTPDAPAYGLWALVLINTAIFAIFAYSFTLPRTARDWRAFGAFTGFSWRSSSRCIASR
jgi:hypothetical protein